MFQAKNTRVMNPPGVAGKKQPEVTASCGAVAHCHINDFVHGSSIDAHKLIVIYVFLSFPKTMLQSK